MLRLNAIRTFGFAAALALVLVVVAPAAYGVSTGDYLAPALWLTAAASIPTSLFVWRLYGYEWGLTAGVTAGLFQGLSVVFAASLGLAGWVTWLFAGTSGSAFALALATGLVETPGTVSLLTNWIRLGVPVALGSLSGVFGFGNWKGAAVVGSSTALCAMLGFVLGRLLRRPLLGLSSVVVYLRALVVPLIGVLIAYLLLVVVFASWFSAIWRFDPHSFANVPASSTFGTFLYLSIVTAATVGYGDIVPVSSVARTFAAAEAVMGLAWLAVSVPAAFAYTQHTFQRHQKDVDAVN